MGVVGKRESQRALARHDGGALDHVLELANIAGPAVLHQLGLVTVGERELAIGQTEVLHCLIQEVLGQKSYVFLTVSQGRELDGESFDEALWRKTLEALTLDEIHGQLRSFEVRFDVKHPPMPVSRPDAPEDGVEGTRSVQALAIVRD